MSKQGIIVIEFDGDDVDLSLPMFALEKIEALTGTGMLRLLSMAETNDLTLTNAALILRIASNKAMNKKQVYSWIDGKGIASLFQTVTELISITFDHGLDDEEDNDGKK